MKKQIAELPEAVRQDESYQNAMKNSDEQKRPNRKRLCHYGRYHGDHIHGAGHLRKSIAPQVDSGYGVQHDIHCTANGGITYHQEENETGDLDYAKINHKTRTHYRRECAV